MNIEEKAYTYMEDILNKLLASAIIPDKKYKQVKDIDKNEVQKWKKEYGIEGVILDIDGTMRIDMKNIDFRNLKWLMKLKEELKVCIVSNGKDRDVEGVAKVMQIPYISFAMKPFKKPFLKAANLMELDPKQILVVGDGYITDILGGKRFGARTAGVDHAEVDSR